MTSETKFINDPKESNSLATIQRTFFEKCYWQALGNTKGIKAI
jgi:hypothetical protein